MCNNNVYIKWVQKMQRLSYLKKKKILEQQKQDCKEYLDPYSGMKFLQHDFRSWLSCRPLSALFGYPKERQEW